MKNEWSFTVRAEHITKMPEVFEISANESERTDLARRLSVVAIDSLAAKVSVKRIKSGRVIYVSGSFSASVTQSCVVSGKDVPAQMEEDFEGWYADPRDAVSFEKARRDKAIEAGHGEQPILSEEDDPEPIDEDGCIDLGELVVQHLSLALDPYPHAKGEHYEIGDDTYTPDVPKAENPFAALKDWKDKLE